MSETSLVLFIDLEPGTRVDLRTAAKAAIAWADLVEEVGSRYDPLHPPSITLESAEPGSQKLKAVIESLVGDPKTAVRTAIISAMIFLAKDTATWTWEQFLEWMAGPDAPEEVQMLSDEDRKAIARDVVDAIQEKLAIEQTQRVFDELEGDTNVTGVGISGQAKERPTHVVSRKDFPPQVFLVEEGGHEKRSRVEKTELVLVRPVLTKETNKRWGFKWSHGKLGAPIKDQSFLERLASGSLNLPMTEGIVFSVELEINEERTDAVWEVREYNVLKVLNVRPPEQQGGFSLDDPEQNESDDNDG